MEEDIFQRKVCSKVEGQGGERVLIMGEAWFPLSWDLVIPRKDFEASALRHGRTRWSPFGAVGCIWNRKLCDRAQESKWKFELHRLRINLETMI